MVQPSNWLSAAWKGLICRRCVCAQKCADSAFCQRLRGKVGDVYALQPGTLRVEGAKLTARALNVANKTEFDLVLTSYGNSVRLFIDEAAPNNRYQVRRFRVPS